MRTVLVTSGGGHLQQMHSLLPRLGLSGDIIWATPRSGLSQSLLGDQTHLELPYLAPRDWRGAIRMTFMARDFLKSTGADRIISTGATPAPPFFLAGASLGLDLHYIESATRSRGPSLSGSLVSRLPQANLYTQYPGWADSRWRFAGSIFDPYTVVAVPTVHDGPRSLVVTLGTEKFGFRRAIERLIEVLPPDVEVLWQVGPSDVSGLGIEARETVPGDELREAIRAADVVVSHAGTGSAVTAFDVGKRPLLLPREARFGEHIDDHQMLTASELQRRGLAVSVPVESLSWDHLLEARASRVIRDNEVRPLLLTDTRPTRRTVDRGVPVRSPWLTSGLRRRVAADGPEVGLPLRPDGQDHARVLAEALAAASSGSAPEAKATLRRLSSPQTATPTTRAQALDGLVDLLRREGKYAECADLLQERLMLPYESTSRRIQSQMQLARFLMESGNLYAAVDSATGSVAEAERSGASATLEGVKLRATLAELLRLRGDLIAAELHIGLALVAADRLGDPVARGSAAWNAALISADQGRYADALGWAQTAEDIFREDAALLSAALVGVVEAMICLDSTAAGADASLEQLEAALVIIREQGTASQQGFVFIQMARLHLRRGDTDQAQTHIQVALAQLGDANVIDTATALAVKAQIMAMAGDHVAAHEVATSAASTLARVGAQRLAESVWADLADIPRMADYMPRAEDSPADGVVVPGPRKAASARRAFVSTDAPL